jgi:transposase
MNEFYPLPGCRIEQVTSLDPAHLSVAADRKCASSRCPDCGHSSDAVHSYYARWPADLPSAGQQVCLELRLRRFYCHNTDCARRTFVERLPHLLAPHARRTHRLAAAQGKVGVFLGGEAGARLLQHLGMPASGDTILRLIRRLPLPTTAAPCILGVDDWAMRKGRTYGTILVDLQRRRVVDLLPDRTSTTLADRLRRHRGIKVVARDRSTEYARGIALGAPRAKQVVDRWHLLGNVRQMVERWLAGVHARLRKLPAVAARDEQAPRRRRTFPRTRSDVAAALGRRARRLALYEEVRQRFSNGEALSAISRAMGLARGTVRRYAYAESFPERAAEKLRPSILDPYLARLEARHAEGCKNALELWRKLRTLGYPGGPRQVRRWLETRGTVMTTPPRCSQDEAGEKLAEDTANAAPALPSPRQLAWLIVRPRDEISAAERTTLARLELDQQAACVIALVQRFVALVRKSGVGQTQVRRTQLAAYSEWLADAASSDVDAVKTFAAGLEQDGAAIRAALTMPWSSGQAEGQINKLKLLKRQTYGRASLDLLRRRMLLAA